MATDPPCVALGEVSEGRALVVTDDENCRKELVQEDLSDYPAIPIATSDEKVKLATGSAEFPFQLTHLQKQIGGSFTKLMIQDADGVWYVYTPTASCVNQRLIVQDGAFILEDDVLPNLLNADICEITSCDQYDYLLGVREITIPCDPDDLTYFEPVLVPKNLCPECVEEEEV